MNLLQEPCEMIFHTVFHPAGMKEGGGFSSTMVAHSVAEIEAPFKS
jgi:hypothetical protein